MYPAERHQQILGRAREDGRVDVAGLARELDVTPETIRRDLTSLERRGLLRRVHGGAIPIERIGVEPAVSEREALLAPEKRRIARAAVKEIGPDARILLDAGTTTMQIAKALPADRPLTVVTHSLPIAAVVAQMPLVRLHVVGGAVRDRTLAAVGPWAVRTLASLHADVLFLGADGVNVEHGITTPDVAEAAVKSQLVESAKRTVLVADHSKIGLVDFAYVAGLDAIDLLITDSTLDDDDAAAIEAAGPQVVRA